MHVMTVGFDVGDKTNLSISYSFVLNSNSFSVLIPRSLVKGYYCISLSPSCYSLISTVILYTESTSHFEHANLCTFILTISVGYRVCLGYHISPAPPPPRAALIVSYNRIAIKCPGNPKFPCVHYTLPSM